MCTSQRVYMFMLKMSVYSLECYDYGMCVCVYMCLRDCVCV